VKIPLLDRLFLLLSVFLAAYQVAVGIDGLENGAVLAYTVAFGVLLVADLLMLLLGLEILDSPVVVIVSTILPLALAFGLVWEYLPQRRLVSAALTAAGFCAVVLTRSLSMRGKLPVFILALVHGAAGLTIFLLPSVLAANGSSRPGFALVGLGGALVGCGGLLLSFLKAGKPILPRALILRILPGLLFIATIAFVAGFALR
jgi:hypothetical protein